MTTSHQLEFFLLRYVPDAVKNEFVNIGLIMLEPENNQRMPHPTRGSLGGDSQSATPFHAVRFTRDWRRVLCLDPGADLDMLTALESDIRRQLTTAATRGQFIAKLHDLLSNVIQLSPTTGCLAADPAKEIETLADLYFTGPTASPRARLTGRQHILATMKEAFAAANVLALMKTNIPAAPYTRPGDPFKFDFGYRIGATVRFFHAVSLKAGVDHAIMLASRYPKVSSGLYKEDKSQALLTAVIDDNLNREDERVQFALASLEEERIQLAAAAEIPAIAEQARRDLHA